MSSLRVSVKKLQPLVPLASPVVTTPHSNLHTQSHVHTPKTPHTPHTPQTTSLPASMSKPLKPLSSHSIAQRDPTMQTSRFNFSTAPNVPAEQQVGNSNTDAREFVASTSHATMSAPVDLIPGSCTMSEIMECVVKIFVTSSSPNYLQPWQTRPLVDSLGSGFIIRGRRILTNAHVVADSIQVMVRRPGSAKKYPAKLEVEDEEFWSIGEQGLEFAEEYEPVDEEYDVDEHNNDGYAPEVSNDTNTRTTSMNMNMNMDVDANVDANIDIDTDGNPSSSSVVDADRPPLPLTVEEIEAKENIPWSSSVFAPDTVPLVGENPAVSAYYKQKGFQKEPKVLYLSRETPLLQDGVVVVGYPMGGDNLCITQGVVSRVEPVNYAHTGTYLLAIQIDAAINPGNSGGPALSNGRVIGVAFQNVVNASSVGYIIPCQVVLHFLKDVEKGGYRIPDKTQTRAKLQGVHKYPTQNDIILQSHLGMGGSGANTIDTPTVGFCSAGFACQDTSNTSIQKHIGLHTSKSGKFSGFLSNMQQQTTSKFTPDTTPAAYLHYRQITLSPEAPKDTGVKWSTRTYQVGKDTISGVLILRVSHVSPCYNVLQRGDVLVAIDDIPVANDGTVLYRGYERISLDYLFSLKHTNDKCKLTYIRTSNDHQNKYQLFNTEITMKPVPKLVPGHGFDFHPQFYIFSGLVCVNLTIPYLMEFGKDWYQSAPKDLVDCTSKNMLFPTQQAVVLAQVLPDQTTVGYSMMDTLLTKCDGVYVKNIAHLSLVTTRALGKGAISHEILSRVDKYGWDILNIAMQSSRQDILDTIAAGTVENVEAYQQALYIQSYLCLLSELLYTSTITNTSTTTNPVTSTILDDMHAHVTVQDAMHRYGSSLEQICHVHEVPVSFLSLLSETNPYREYFTSPLHQQPLPLTYVEEEDGRLIEQHKSTTPTTVTDATTTTTTTSTSDDHTSTTTIHHLGVKNPYNTASQIIHNTMEGAHNTHMPGSVITQAAMETVFGPIENIMDKSTPISDRIDRVNTNSIVYELADSRVIILDATEAVTRHQDIMIKHNIPCDSYLG